ncbi:MAG: hypothetical protein U9R27_05820 [Campylobacterota bacterium]|nr:hypothetical protein [Campylobacterota bacterium]
MIRRYTLLIILLSSWLFPDMEWRFENTNFTLSQASFVPYEDINYLYNYDRMRLRSDWKDGHYFVTAIGDVVNYLGREYVASTSFGYISQIRSDTPFKTESSFYDYKEGMIYAKLYRLYGGYDDAKNRIVAGLQNITMGVGRIWTPTNLFNPRNTYALEPDETFGVAALSYTRYLSETSQLSVVASQREDNSFKYAVRYKMSLSETDIALSAIRSNKTDMIGYAIEGDLGDTGIEWRSEGAFIKSSLNSGTSMLEDEKKLFQGIIGADYAFQSGLNLTVEALYSSETFSYEEIAANIDTQLVSHLHMSHLYFGTTIYYDFTIYLSGSLLYIESFGSGELDENSRFISPALTYTLNDNNAFVLGAMIQNGSNQSEFGMIGNTYYLKYTLSF